MDKKKKRDVVFKDTDNKREFIEEPPQKMSISKKPTTDNNITIDAFFSYSREARQRGSYLEKGFRVWRKANVKQHTGFLQSKEKWLSDFDSYAKLEPQ